ncbi:GH1 family beta-glucosidase [Dyadobacter fermentans]|uniref:Beta-glucosidase n=1 Tax=Dyadobacter fermentans (strain ATCC 700827 / DSM 18053 / CIP 107007 / KCTC 52180 / NS114) TaxID=471854 RepID=C6W5Y0_DYAFD|nr:GH1 family beta-glucosidase [Dyadobacter fermentans]ACT96069.1 beta-galactosidase [Dyadobacter fermentans DSM 18053]
MTTLIDHHIKDSGYEQAVAGPLSRASFGSDFKWGVATAAYQIEGAVNEDGRSDCNWDVFTRKKGKISNGDHARHACDFYHRYEQDLELVKELGFKVFRFSLSWSRILPDGHGRVNQAGIDFYNRLIDRSIALDIEPWITLYHWDLPQILEKSGGWKNRRVVEWFAEYTAVCAHAFGDRVRHWIVLNEPLAVAGLGYTTGEHAPGSKGIHNFLPVVHHLALSQAEAGRVLRAILPHARIGNAISCSYVHPNSQSAADVRAARRADAIMNRLFIEPALGLGYPKDAFPFLSNIKRFMREGDREKLKFDFDFWGLQNYFSVVVQHSYLAPVLWLKEVPATLRNAPTTALGWEISPAGMYEILKQFSRYEGVRELVISENGAAFKDKLKDGKVDDTARQAYYHDYLGAVLKARNDGVNVTGYFAWTLLDNFEWAHGYSARFGLVYVDFKTQERIVKSSGRWFADFLNQEEK